LKSERQKLLDYIEKHKPKRVLTNLYVINEHMEITQEWGSDWDTELDQCRKYFKGEK
jgi:hypothetical protein